MSHHTNQRNEQNRLLEDVLEENYIVVLKIHAVWWFSQGNYMTCLLQCMPIILELYRDEEPHWYETMCSFDFPFLYLNLLVDVFHKLNKLNIKFQYDMVMSQQSVQPFIWLFLCYHIIFNSRMDLSFVIQAIIWENTWGNLHEMFGGVMKIIHEIVQLMGPINYNKAYYWVHLMYKELFMLWMIVS